MNIPEFTAEASLCRTSNRYRSSSAEHVGQPSAHSVFPAYMPGSDTTASCNSCLKTCTDALFVSSGTIALSVASGCLTIIGCPIAVAAGEIALEGAMVAFAACVGYCELPVYGECCPKICGFPDPLTPGSGCCDKNEHCVEQSDPNARQGCCPSDQSVCAGKCCAKGESCCGDTCCPPNYFCRDGGFCSEFPSDFPNTPPPPPPFNNCIFGGEPCQGKCCPPGTVCCGGSPGQPDCKIGSGPNACLH